VLEKRRTEGLVVPGLSILLRVLHGQARRVFHGSQLQWALQVAQLGYLLCLRARARCAIGLQSAMVEEKHEVLTHFPISSTRPIFFPGRFGSSIGIFNSWQRATSVGTRILLAKALVVFAVLSLVRACSSSPSVGGSCWVRRGRLPSFAREHVSSTSVCWHVMQPKIPYRGDRLTCKRVSENESALSRFLPSWS